MEEEYYKTKASVDEYIELAKDVNGSALIAQLKQVLSSGSTVLEIGSGPGTDWEILNESYTVTGSDNSPEFLSRLNTKYPTGEFLQLDAASINSNKTYNAIYSNKVLHHLEEEDLKNSIKKQHELLKDNGIICHSFWKGKGDEIFKGLYVNYHEKEELINFFKPYFEILSIISYQEFDLGDSILLIGKKK